MYIKVIDSVAQAYSIAQLRADNPNVSFPADFPASLLAQYDVYLAINVDPPVYDTILQTVRQDGYEFVSNQWQTKWLVENKDNATLQAEVDSIELDISQNDETLKVIARTTVQLVLAARDGNLDGLTEQDVWTEFRTRVGNQLRATRGL